MFVEEVLCFQKGTYVCKGGFIPVEEVLCMQRRSYVFGGGLLFYRLVLPRFYCRRKQFFDSVHTVGAGIVLFQLRERAMNAIPGEGLTLPSLGSGLTRSRDLLCFVDCCFAQPQQHLQNLGGFGLYYYAWTNSSVTYEPLCLIQS